MAPVHPLDDLFQHAEYRVRIARGGYATIRIGAPLPPALLDLLPGADSGWGFITAWNPQGKSRDRLPNRLAQRELRDVLRQKHPHARLCGGIGTLGAWREPSLFVVDIDAAALDSLMLRFDQLAVVLGNGSEPASLRWSARHVPARR